MFAMFFGLVDIERRRRLSQKGARRNWPALVFARCVALRRTRRRGLSELTPPD